MFIYNDGVNLKEQLAVPVVPVSQLTGDVFGPAADGRLLGSCSVFTAETRPGVASAAGPRHSAVAY